MNKKPASHEARAKVLKFEVQPNSIFPNTHLLWGRTTSCARGRYSSENMTLKWKVADVSTLSSSSVDQVAILRLERWTWRRRLTRQLELLLLYNRSRVAEVALQQAPQVSRRAGRRLRRRQHICDGLLLNTETDRWLQGMTKYPCGLTKFQHTRRNLGFYCRYLIESLSQTCKLKHCRVNI